MEALYLQRSYGKDFKRKRGKAIAIKEIYPSNGRPEITRKTEKKEYLP